MVVVAREIVEESYPVEDNFFDMWQEGQINNPYQSVTLEAGGDNDDLIPWEDWDESDDESLYCVPISGDVTDEGDDESIMSLPRLQTRCNYEEDDSSADESDDYSDEPWDVPSTVPSLVRIRGVLPWMIMRRIQTAIRTPTVGT